MGAAKFHGEAWGAKARDWAELQEPSWRPIYEAMLRRCGVHEGTRVLDVGCGAGGALVVARELGAKVTGIDGATRLIDIARERLPDAGLEVGDMEALPFADAAFDLVTSFNSFQFAQDLPRALREARRVCRPGGTVLMLVWGPKEACDLVGTTLAAVLALLPPSPPSAPLSQAGTMEALFSEAGLVPGASGELDCEFRYPDAEGAWRAISSAGMMVRAIRHVGEEKVKAALLGSLAAFTRSDGSVVQRNRFRWASATRA
jgi:SAM-dependent methyltransferase